jgi:glucose-1-phosphate adenylyltransferase
MRAQGSLACSSSMTAQSCICIERPQTDANGALQNTMMMGADLYETEDEISRLLAEGKVPIGVGENTKIR